MFEKIRLFFKGIFEHKLFGAIEEDLHRKDVAMRLFVLSEFAGLPNPLSYILLDIMPYLLASGGFEEAFEEPSLDFHP
ncbi:hypothetical protein Pogu_1963 [Pyrobaculum oguniense TE7]|uniref:Uncharacterized protein n=1 Tax=Pyrobaculum oguniense (strain DSM 13380 / JCM 10595 / TE7) TaxID=698757 RepID=H6QCM2_PYROT|nr:hypothetical protein Pogu_1963 [Pyrobaculum oguniense TE7]